MDEGKVEAYLEKLDLNPSDRGRYWLIRCPRHEDRSPSAQCFKDDGFVECHAGCGRFNINEVAKERGDPPVVPFSRGVGYHTGTVERKPEKEEKVVTGDFTEMWLGLDPLDNDLDVKGVSGLELNKRGWRKFPGNGALRPGIFIPYFDTTRQFVPFYQIRHLEGERRFTFAPGITPICYGFEQLPRCKKYLCFTEGSRDSVILGMVGVPAIALPSASSNKLMEKLMAYCRRNHLRPVAICDRDEAGESLIAECGCPILDFRSPVGKDVGDFFEKEGLEAVRKYYSMFAVEGV